MGWGKRSKKARDKLAVEKQRNERYSEAYLSDPSFVLDAETQRKLYAALYGAYPAFIYGAEHLFDGQTRGIRGLIVDPEDVQAGYVNLDEPEKAEDLMYLRLERSYNEQRQTFVFRLEVSREWFIKKKNPGASLLRWFEKVAHKEVAWRARTPGFEEILRRQK